MPLSGKAEPGDGVGTGHAEQQRHQHCHDRDVERCPEIGSEIEIGEQFLVAAQQTPSLGQVNGVVEWVLQQFLLGFQAGRDHDTEWYQDRGGEYDESEPDEKTDYATFEFMPVHPAKRNVSEDPYGRERDRRTRNGADECRFTRAGFTSEFNRSKTGGCQRRHK